VGLLIPFPGSERAILASQFVRQLRRLTSTPRVGDIDAGIREEVAGIDPWMLRLVAIELTPEESARWIG
jgi:hypothetical protein